MNENVAREFLNRAIDVIPPHTFITLTEASHGFPGGGWEHDQVGFEVALQDPEISREAALAVYEKIREKLPDTHLSSFVEEDSADGWIYTLSFEKVIIPVAG